MKIRKNFEDTEFVCGCGCGVQKMDDDFLDNLQELRTKCGFGFKINSGWRCNEHNTKVSKNSMGDHPRGYAVDIHCPDRYKRAKILYFALVSKRFKDIAISKTFIHIGKGKKEQGIGIYG